MSETSVLGWVVFALLGVGVLLAHEFDEQKLQDCAKLNNVYACYWVATPVVPLDTPK